MSRKLAKVMFALSGAALVCGIIALVALILRPVLPEHTFPDTGLSIVAGLGVGIALCGLPIFGQMLSTR